MPPVAPMTPADPTWTASVYAAARLDNVFLRVLVPFWRDRMQVREEDDFLIWPVRYSRRGEHLKLRLHCNSEHDAEREADLARRIETFLKDTGATSVENPDAALHQPAIDREDEDISPVPDGSLVRTSYRRSQVTLGFSPWLDNDEYVVRACICLARGGDLLLNELAVQRAWTGGIRQRVVIQAAATALSRALDGSAATIGSYLDYHRDWLLRFGIPDVDARREILVQFDRQAANSQGAIERISKFAAGSRRGPQLNREKARWAAAFTELYAYADSFREEPQYRVDDYAPESAFLPMFKVLHGIANQCGLSIVDEAYVYHLLISSDGSAFRA